VVVKFVFSHSKSRKQPFFAEIFKIQGGPWPSLPSPSDAHAGIYPCACSIQTHYAQACNTIQEVLKKTQKSDSAKPLLFRCNDYSIFAYEVNSMQGFYKNFPAGMPKHHTHDSTMVTL